MIDRVKSISLTHWLLYYFVELREYFWIHWVLERDTIFVCLKMKKDKIKMNTPNAHWMTDKLYYIT